MKVTSITMNQQQLSMCLLGGRNLLHQPAVWAVKNNFIAWKIVDWDFSCPSFCQNIWEQSMKSFPKFSVESLLSSWGLKSLPHIIFDTLLPWLLTSNFCSQNFSGRTVKLVQYLMCHLSLSKHCLFHWISILYESCYTKQNALENRMLYGRETDRHTRRIYVEILECVDCSYFY